MRNIDVGHIVFLLMVVFMTVVPCVVAVWIADRVLTAIGF